MICYNILGACPPSSLPRLQTSYKNHACFGESGVPKTSDNIRFWNFQFELPINFHGVDGFERRIIILGKRVLTGKTQRLTASYTLKKPRNPKNIYFVAVFWALLDPVWRVDVSLADGTGE